MIPKKIHRIIIVDGDEIPTLPKEMEDAMKTFLDCNPGYTQQVYSGKDCVEYIKQFYDQETLDCYLALKPYAFRADLMRYLILYNEGGWYADSKMICYQPFESLQQKEIYLCIDASINPNCMANGFMGSEPKHPILKKCIDMVKFNISQEHYGLDCLHVTGPGVLFSAAIDYVRKNMEKVSLGRHIISNNNRCVMVFDKTVLLQVKYNSPPQGGIYSDIKGGNNYGEMWRNWNVY